MSLGSLEIDETHPIDIAEVLAEFHNWQFNRVDDDQLAMTIEDQWQKYSITLAWCGGDETLRLICTFELDPPEDRLSALYQTLNLTNDLVWCGSFSFWNDQKLMVWRYGLSLAGVQVASQAQIDKMIIEAVENSERFYPSFQLVCWGDNSPAQAMDIAMTKAYGRA